MTEREVFQQIQKELGSGFRFPSPRNPQRLGFDVYHVDSEGRPSEFVLTISPNKKYCQILKAHVEPHGRMCHRFIARVPVGSVAAVLKMES